MKNHKPSLQQPGSTEAAPEAGPEAGPDAVVEIIATGIVATESATESSAESARKFVARNAKPAAPASSIHILGRRVVLAGLGVILFSVDQVQSLVVRATERGQMIEEDVQHKLAEASERSTAAVSSTLASLLNHLPGVRVTYKPLPDQPPKQDDAPAASAKTPE